MLDISEYNPDVEEIRSGRLIVDMIYHFALGMAVRINEQRLQQKQQHPQQQHHHQQQLQQLTSSLSTSSLSSISSTSSGTSANQLATLFLNGDQRRGNWLSGSNAAGSLYSSNNSGGVSSGQTSIQSSSSIAVMAMIEGGINGSHVDSLYNSNPHSNSHYFLDDISSEVYESNHMHTASKTAAALGSVNPSHVSFMPNEISSTQFRGNSNAFSGNMKTTSLDDTDSSFFQFHQQQEIDSNSFESGYDQLTTFTRSRSSSLGSTSNSSSGGALSSLSSNNPSMPEFQLPLHQQSQQQLQQKQPIVSEISYLSTSPSSRSYLHI